MIVTVHGPATFLALGRLRGALEVMDDETRVVVLDLARATLVDHTFLERLHGIASEWRYATLETRYDERLKPASEHPMASRTLVRAPEAHV